MSQRKLIRDVLAVLPDEKEPVRTDILVNASSGLIEKISPNQPAGDAAVIADFAGKTVFPGFIDPHVHFRTPGKEEAEDWEHASRGALFAGVTTALDMPNTNPPTIDRESYEIKKKAIMAQSRINFGIFGGLTRDNLHELAGIPEIKGIKVYMASTTGSLLVDDLSALAGQGLDEQVRSKVFFFHAEKESLIQSNLARLGEIRTPWDHSQVRNAETAIVATREVIDLQKKTGLEFHISHVTTPQEVDMLNGSPLSYEVCPHHIFCSIEDYENGGFLWKCNPPLREKELADRLLSQLRAEKIMMIGTDHAPHTMEEKKRTDILPPSGVPSIEIGTQLILGEFSAGRISAGYTAKILASRAAARYGISRRGEIREGWHADLAFYDPSVSWVMEQKHVFSKVGWSPFVGRRFQGKVIATMLHGWLISTENIREEFSSFRPPIREV